MDEYLHIEFNPTMIMSIEKLIKEREISIEWQLSHIVTITNYLWVAVFSRFNGYK
jgi:hypothetical protein